jgi:predicted transcriptional regulator with HTH domain
MKSQDFASGIMREVVDENVSIYRDLFSETSASEASDPYWRRALGLFNSLSDEQRSVFFEIVRQVSVDTASNVLGVLDGVNSIEGGEAGFSLLSGTGEKLNSDLQSFFLVEDESRRK